MLNKIFSFCSDYNFEGATPMEKVRLEGLTSAQNYFLRLTTTAIYGKTETSLTPLNATTGKTLEHNCGHQTIFRRENYKIRIKIINNVSACTYFILFLFQLNCWFRYFIILLFILVDYFALESHYSVVILSVNNCQIVSLSL